MTVRQSSKNSTRRESSKRNHYIIISSPRVMIKAIIIIPSNRWWPEWISPALVVACLVANRITVRTVNGITALSASAERVPLRVCAIRSIVKGVADAAIAVQASLTLHGTTVFLGPHDLHTHTHTRTHTNTNTHTHARTQIQRLVLQRVPSCRSRRLTTRLIYEPHDSYYTCLSSRKRQTACMMRNRTYLAKSTSLIAVDRD